MRIYIAARTAEAAEDLALALEGQGHEIVSSWHDNGADTEFPVAKEERRWGADENLALIAQHAKMDEEDEGKFAVVVHVGDGSPCPGGIYLEAGFALGLGTRVIMLGKKRPSLMMHASDVERAATAKGVLALLKRKKKSFAY